MILFTKAVLVGEFWKVFEVNVMSNVVNVLVVELSLNSPPLLTYGRRRVHRFAGALRFYHLWIF